jgi:hypothetical protein
LFEAQRFVIIARPVVYMAAWPLDANVQFMTVMATGMPYNGRGCVPAAERAVPS